MLDKKWKREQERQREKPSKFITNNESASKFFATWFFREVCSAYTFHNGFNLKDAEVEEYGPPHNTIDIYNKPLKVTARNGAHTHTPTHKTKVEHLKGTI